MSAQRRGAPRHLAELSGGCEPEAKAGEEFPVMPMPAPRQMNPKKS